MPAWQDLRVAVEEIRKNPESAEKNRIGVLLSNKGTKDSTMTLTHTLWALYDVLPPHSVQKPHRCMVTASRVWYLTSVARLLGTHQAHLLAPIL